MIKVLVNDGIHSKGKYALEGAGFQVDSVKVAQENLSKVLPTYDVIIVRSATKVRAELIDCCPNLKIIARGGVGLDNIDVDYAKNKGIEVINTPAASSLSVAELVAGHMFTLSRFLQLANRQLPEQGSTNFKALKKAYAKGAELRGKTLGIIGFGRIGQEVAQIGLALGMKIMPVDLIIDQAEISIDVIGSDTGLKIKLDTIALEEMLQKCDYLTLHVPFSGGKAIIGAPEIAQMKDSAFIINTARGGAIDEEALLEAINNGKLAGAGLDVFENEPTPNQALLNHPKVSVSPHIGASTLEAQANIGLELAEKIISYFKN